MMSYTTDLTVPQFDLLEQFLPQSRTFKSIISRHRIVNAIFYQLKNGYQWRASAGGFSQLIKRLSAVQRRQLDGTWEKVLAALALAERKTVKKNEFPSLLIGDSMCAKNTDTADIKIIICRRRVKISLPFFVKIKL